MWQLDVEQLIVVVGGEVSTGVIQWPLLDVAAYCCLLFICLFWLLQCV